MRYVSLSGDETRGLWVPGIVSIGNFESSVDKYYIFIQNDSYINPSSAWYVSKVDDRHYIMPRASAPKSQVYIGGFKNRAGGGALGRLDASARWTSSNSAVVSVVSVTVNGQAIININKPGEAVLTVRWHGLTSELKITVK